MKSRDLEDRLIHFSVIVIDIATQLPRSPAGKYFENQLTRSGSSSALNYGEAVSAESTKDFRHKLSLSLKELRETHMSLKILFKSPYLNPNEISDAKIRTALKECNELVAIFVSSIKTLDSKKRVTSR